MYKMVLTTHPTLEIAKERGKIANEEDLGVNCAKLLLVIIIDDYFSVVIFNDCLSKNLFVSTWRKNNIL